MTQTENSMKKNHMGGCQMIRAKFWHLRFFPHLALPIPKSIWKSSSQKNYAFLSYDVYMTYITSRDISRESREATDQSERLNKYGSHRCFLPGRIGRKRLCRRLSFFGPRTLTVTLPKPLWSVLDNGKLVHLVDQIPGL